MSDDDTSDTDSVEDVTHSDTNGTTATTNDMNATTVATGSMNGAAANTNDMTGHSSNDHAAAEDESDGWSCAAPKTHKKSGARGVAARPAQALKKNGQNPPLTVEMLSPEHTIELYDFPAVWRTADIRKFMSPFDHQYRIKWQSDTSCFIHFETSELANRAMQELPSDVASLRVFAPENVIQQAPKTEAHSTPETTLEVYGFPATWRSDELNKVLTNVAGQYRLKWRNDASCFVIFDSREILENGKLELAKEAAIKDVMTDLPSVLLSTSNRDSVDTTHGVDLNDLKRALDKSALGELVEKNHSDFTAYLSSLNNLERIWRPLEVESAQRRIYGDDRAVSLSCLKAVLDDMTNESEDFQADYLKYLERQMGQKAGELARLPNYEKCAVSISDGEYTINSVISQKTRQLVEFLEMTIALSDEDTIRAAISDCCLLFLEIFRNAFASQLLQLPHLAALFYNDSRYLSVFTKVKCSGTTEVPERMGLIGAEILQNSLNRNRDEIGDLFTAKAWQLRYGQLDRDSLSNIQRTLDQALLRLSQIRKVLLPILDPDMFATIILELVENVLSWLWNGLISIKSLSRDVLPMLPDFVQNLNRSCVDVVGAEICAKNPLEICKKLDYLLKISMQNLIQVSNAFRRDEYIDTLTLQEFRSVISFTFPDTAMKDAFLAEIDAEIN
ncbi:hypothetical protein PSACC_02815 [Paramicrosporidium saccamoebae]|uniref:Uncharacterized protein n=1 Tax=Paramicrosporidium saccamoebae TaxID=1246581 RepID=A0A2H9THU8_9FUNG|nr:hypothetical protein PSACC_02815 [Paramicrosporidium saccamoebae]